MSKHSFSPYFSKSILVFTTSMIVSIASLAADQKQIEPSTTLMRGVVSISVGDLKEELSELDSETLKRIESDPSLIRDVLENLYIRKSLANQTKLKASKDNALARRLSTSQERFAAELALKSIDSEQNLEAPELLAYANTVYKADPKRFMSPGATNVKHILFRANNLDELCTAIGKAKRVAEQIGAGASFEALALTESEDETSASKGGDLGYLSPNVLIPALDKAISLLSKPGEISPLVQTEAGIHIIKLVDRKAGELKPFEEVKAILISEASTKVKTSARKNAISKMLASAKIDENTLKTINDTEKR